MNFYDYQLSGRATYVAFVEAVRAILAALVDAHGFTPHAITGRAKDPVSLRKKLAKNGVPEDSAIDEQLKDLAGCRIVFLTNSQVAAFRSTGAILENFDIVNINEHHPVPGTDTEDKLFDSTNYLVTLKPARAVLPEYRRFAGLKVEIQIQTLLNHAWAEMGHDTIYKEPELQHVDPRHLAAINERMKQVMREHLLPAGHDFDKIARDFRRILNADTAVDATLATIASSSNNDELLEAFETADTLILPLIADNRDVFVNLVPQVASAVERVRGTTSAPVSSVLGDFPGKAGTIVARRAADMIGHGLYVDLKVTLATLVRLYAGATTDEERKIWRDLGARFASHDLDTWQALRGPGVQRNIVDGITALGDGERGATRGLVTAMMAKILSCEITGMRRGKLNTILLDNGTVGTGEPLRQVRADAIDILERYLEEAADDAASADILAALWQAASPPVHGGSEALRVQVMDDAIRVATLVRERATGWGLELRRQTEAQAERVHRNFRTLPPAMADDAALVDAHARLVPTLLALRDALNGDDEFVLYKTLVGHNSVPPSAWDNPAVNHRAIAAWRAERFAALAEDNAPGSADAWIARLRQFLPLAATGQDRWPIGEFVEILVQRQPAIGARLLDDMDEMLQPVLVRLLLGLEAAGETALVDRHVARFIGEGRFLPDLADWLGRRLTADIERLVTVGDRARELGEPDAVLQAVNAASRLSQSAPDAALSERVLLPAIAFFAAGNDPFWIHHALSLLEGSMVGALDESQAHALLQSFVAIPDLDYDNDRILAVVAGNFPGLVFDFFSTRLARDRTGGTRRFEPIPFDIHDLRDALARYPAQLLAAARDWYRRDPRFHVYQGGRLVHNVFPELDDALATPLAAMIAAGDRDDLAFVLETLAAFDGHARIVGLCMDVVDRLEPGDDLLGRVSDVLGERGVLTGDFGAVEAERAEFEALGAWAADPRSKVAAFVADEQRRLRQTMAGEQRSAAREVEDMRREWGPGDEAAGGTTADGAA